MALVSSSLHFSLTESVVFVGGNEDCNFFPFSLSFESIDSFGFSSFSLLFDGFFELLLGGVSFEPAFEPIVETQIEIYT